MIYFFDDLFFIGLMDLDPHQDFCISVWNIPQDLLSQLSFPTFSGNHARTAENVASMKALADA